MAAYISSSYTFRRQCKLHRVLPLDQRIELARSVFLRHTSAQATCTQTSRAVAGTRVSSAGRNGVSTFPNRRRGTSTTLQRRIIRGRLISWTCRIVRGHAMWSFLGCVSRRRRATPGAVCSTHTTTGLDGRSFAAVLGSVALNFLQSWQRRTTRY